MRTRPTATVVLLPVGALALGGLWLGPAIAAASGPPAAVPAAGTCQPGLTTVSGARYRQFCGPARATVKTGGRVLSFRGGQCSKTSSYIAVNIGAAALGQGPRPARPYFGLVVGKLPGAAVMGGRPAGSDGTYKGVDLAFNYGGTRYLMLSATVALSGDRTTGSFAGKLLTGGQASGTFHC